MTAATVLDSEDTIETEIRRTARATKEASQILALADVATKNAALRAAAAAIRGEEPLDAMLSLIDEEDNYVGVIMHNRLEGDVRYFLGHPLAMIGSDGNAISPKGIFGGEKHHPRY